MAAAGEPGQDGALFDTVRAVGMELCPELDIAVPVGKDSLSMKTVWRDEDGNLRLTMISDDGFKTFWSTRFVEYRLLE